MLGVASIWSTRYDDIDVRSEAPRTSIVTDCDCACAKCSAACPAELAPPTTYTSSPAQLIASVSAAP